MDIIKATTDIFDWTIHNTAISLQAFLEGNYYMVAFFIRICNSVTNSAIETLKFANNVLQCYYFDFVAFLGELGVGINFIATIICSFLLKIIDNISFVLNYIVDSIYCLYLKIVFGSHVVNYYFSVGVENCLYFINLFFAAILLILQLGPNLLLLLCNAIFYSILYTLDFIKLTFHLSLQYCIELFYKCQHFIITIPPKAYFGVILLIFIYYSQEIIKRNILICCIYLAYFVYKLFSCVSKILQYVFRIVQSVLNRFPNRHENAGGSAYICQNIVRDNILSFVRILKMPFRKHSESEQFSSERERYMCVVCQDKEKNVLLIPCRHLCMCEDCTDTVQQSYLGCPLCRKQILDTVRVYT